MRVKNVSLAEITMTWLFRLRFLNNILPFALVAACGLVVKSASYTSFLALAVLTAFICIWRKYGPRTLLGVALVAAVTGSLFLIGDLLEANETGGYAYVFFALSIASGIMSYARKKIGTRTIDLRQLNHLLPLLLVVFFVALVGDYLGIWTGFPLGDDAYIHVGKALFILDHFPNISWYPYWYLGFDIFRAYPSTYYILVAVSHFLTGVSVPFVIVIFFFSSMVLLGYGIYGLSRLLSLPRIVSLGLAVMLLSFPVSWGWAVTGGAYIRSFALPFFVLSVLAVYLHTLKINSGRSDLKMSIVATFLLAFTVLLHHMMLIFVSIATILLYCLAIRGIGKKIEAVLKVFIPVGGLVAWTYLPILEDFITSEGEMIHEIFYEGYERLLIVYNLAFLPLVAISAVIVCFVLVKHRPKISRERTSFLLVFLILSVYFFLFGWVQMPRSLYIMAAYDYRNWFGYSSIMLLAGILSLIYAFLGTYRSRLRLPAIRSYEGFFNSIVALALIIMVPAAFLISLPTINVMNINPEDPESWVHYLRNDTDQIVAQLPENYRLAFASRRIFAFHYFEYPYLQTTGGRQVGQLHPYYSSIFSERVFFRYPGEYEKYYFEEQPLVHSKVPYMEDNYYSSMFWLDWFGAGGVVIAPWETQIVTFNEYTLRPQFFEARKFGNTVFAQYAKASPIVMSTNESTLGIVTSDEDEENYYSETLITLGEINLNSQWIIPLKLTIADLTKDMYFLDSLLVSPVTYETYQTLLEDYTCRGGHLIIMDYAYTRDEMKLAESVNLGFRFSTYATPLSECPPSSEILAETADGPLACRLHVDMGLITRSAVSIHELYEMATPEASLYLAGILIPDFTLTKVCPIPNSWYVRDSEGIAQTFMDQNSNGEMTFKYELNMTWQTSRVSLTTPIEGEMSTSANGIVQFELWNDDGIQSFEIMQESTKSEGSLQYTVSNSSWKGWKMFTIPFAAFVRKTNADLLDSFDRIAITPVCQPSYHENNCTLKVRRLSLYEFEQTPSYRSVEGRWVQPNRFEVSSGDGIASLLWKSTYTSDWMIETKPATNVKYYYAGPGVVFTHFPQTVESVTFLKPLSDSQRAGILISLLMLPSLLFLYIYASKSAQSNKASRAETL